MTQTPDELLTGLRGAGATGAFTFPMHEPDGYPPANDMVLAAAAAAPINGRPASATATPRRVGRDERSSMRAR